MIAPHRLSHQRASRARASPIARHASLLVGVPRNNIRGMTTTRKDRREFLKSSLSTAAIAASAWPRASATSQPPAASPRPARLRFSAIGLNHGHINGQVESVIRGGGELVSFFATEPDLIAAFTRALSAGAPGPESERDPGRCNHRTRRERVDSQPARAARHRRHAAWQGLHGRQARHHHARAAGRGPQSPGRDQTHLLDPLQ